MNVSDAGAVAIKIIRIERLGCMPRAGSLSAMIKLLLDKLAVTRPQPEAFDRLLNPREMNEQLKLEIGCGDHARSK